MELTLGLADLGEVWGELEERAGAGDAEAARLLGLLAAVDWRSPLGTATLAVAEDDAAAVAALTGGTR